MTIDCHSCGTGQRKMIGDKNCKENSFLSLSSHIFKSSFEIVRMQTFDSFYSVRYYR